MIDQAAISAIQTSILTLRGQAQGAEELDWLEATTRRVAEAELTILCLTAAAGARAALDEREAVATLLTEIKAIPDTRVSHYYANHLPAMVRTALTIGTLELAEQLVAGVEPRAPLAEHALVAVNAALAEARGELQGAADGYGQATQRWQQFGVTPEQAHALLGEGRCLTALGRSAEAIRALGQARGIFDNLKAAPALGEIDTLLNQADTLTA